MNNLKNLMLNKFPLNLKLKSKLCKKTLFLKLFKMSFLIMKIILNWPLLSKMKYLKSNKNMMINSESLKKNTKSIKIIYSPKLKNSKQNSKNIKFSIKINLNLLKNSMKIYLNKKKAVNFMKIKYTT
jgi:hypothetical protein